MLGGQAAGAAPATIWSAATYVNGNRVHRSTPRLWLDGNAKETMNFYAAICKNVQIGDVTNPDRDNRVRKRDVCARWSGVHRAEWRSDVPGNMALRGMRASGRD
jgi:hypothetical protein